MGLKCTENETLEEFNSKFDKAVAVIQKTHHPTPDAILMYYIIAFSRDFSFDMNKANPQNLIAAKQEALNLERSWKASRKLDLFHQSRPRGETVKGQPSLYQQQ